MKTLGMAREITIEVVKFGATEVWKYVDRRG
jgi:hypothetical protein